MRRAPNALPPALLAGLALMLAGCQSQLHEWVPPQDCSVKIISDAELLRTDQGEYVDGYLAENESESRKQQMFIVLEIARYLKGDRLILTGRFTHDSVRVTFGDRIGEWVPVFEVERARPNIPSAPELPALK